MYHALRGLCTVLIDECVYFCVFCVSSTCIPISHLKQKSHCVCHMNLSQQSICTIFFAFTSSAVSSFFKGLHIAVVQTTGKHFISDSQ